MFAPRIYTVESVTSGHPDKVCDQISDAILDELLRQDPLSRVAIETFGGHGLLLVCGEVTTRAKVNYGEIARQVYNEIGYTQPVRVISNIVEQSPDIALGVDTGGAGDQGVMYGYACNETPQFMPRAVMLAHALSAGLEKLRRDGTVPWLKPDGKTQVTMEHGRVKAILVSCQHEEGISEDKIQRTIIEKLVAPEVLKFPQDVIHNIEILVNPTGNFVRGGFEADTGLTGRKLMVDTYGGLAPHGGGAFSGKDATKVDRSAAYMARFVARKIVERGFAKRCLVSVAYAIGRQNPIMLEAQNENGGSLTPLLTEYDFRPAAIIERLGLRKPIFQKTATYGHFGRPGLPWE